MCLYGVNLGYIPGNQTEHVCMCACVCVFECVKYGHRAFNVHNHHHDPCQINRERLDGRQGAEHMEKGSWEREGEGEGGGHLHLLQALIRIDIE